MLMTPGSDAEAAFAASAAKCELLDPERGRSMYFSAIDLTGTDCSEKLASQTSARITAAFAKYDGARQGQLAPSDFAAAMRDLGVDLASGSVSKLAPRAKPAVMGNLSSDTVDYLQFVASLEPPSAQALVAQATKPPAPKVPAKRCFGTYAHTRHSSITTLGGDASPGGGGGGGGQALHEHAAFADRAGIPAEQAVIEVPRRRKPAATPPADADKPIFHDGSRRRRRSRRCPRRRAAAIDVSDAAPAYAAGLSTASRAAGAQQQQVARCAARRHAARRPFLARPSRSPRARLRRPPLLPGRGCRTSSRAPTKSFSAMTSIDRRRRRR